MSLFRSNSDAKQVLEKVNGALMHKDKKPPSQKISMAIAVYYEISSDLQVVAQDGLDREVTDHEVGDFPDSDK